MTAATGPNLQHFHTPDADIRAFGAWELVIVTGRPPSQTMRRIAILERILETCGTEGLYTIEPAAVARKFYGGRRDSGRKTRTAAIMISTLYDFRAWYARQ